MKKSRLLGALYACVLSFGIPLTSNAATIDLVASERGSPYGFFEIDENTGGAALVGTSTLLFGLDYRSDGVLYGSSNKLYTVDPSDGSAAFIGNLPDIIIGVTFSSTDELYGLTNDGSTLWKLNPDTGAIISGVFLSGARGRQIEFGADGSLYTIAAGGVHVINPATGVSTLHASLNGISAIPQFGSLDYGLDGMLRAYSASSISDLYLINPDTGFTTLIGPTTVSPPAIEISGLASAPAVPIPAAIWLFGSGLLGLIGVARKKAA